MVHLFVRYRLFFCFCAFFSLHLWERASILLALPVGVCTQMCVKVTRRLLFPLMCITLTHFGSRKGKKQGLLWHTLLEVSPGGAYEIHTGPKTHTHTYGILLPPSPCCFDDAREASQHGGAPLESGTDGQKETTHWSWLTTFMLCFSTFCFRLPSTSSNRTTSISYFWVLWVHMIKCEDVYVCIMYPFICMPMCGHAYVCLRELRLSNYFRIPSKTNVCCLPSAGD